jgi:hypothetical protein
MVWINGSLLCVFRNTIKQCCQMVYFQTENPIFGKSWMALQWNMLVYFIAIWSILWPLDIVYCRLVHFVVMWYIFPHLVCCTKENLATLLSSCRAWFLFLAPKKNYALAFSIFQKWCLQLITFHFKNEMLKKWKTTFLSFFYDCTLLT